MKSLERVYREHHERRRRTGFAILEGERGRLFRTLVGTGRTVLDIGCRDGTLTKYFSGGNHVTGVDIDSSALARAREKLGIETVHLDLQDEVWPFAPASFDVIVAGEVLEHVYFPDEVIRKVSLLLKPGGVFVGSVPNAFSLKCRLRYLFGSKRGTPMEDPMHINQFSWRGIETLLSSPPLKDVRLYPLGRPLKGLKTAIPSLFAYGIAFRVFRESA